MENVFTTELISNNTSTVYHITFENEKYIFKAADSNAAIPSFSLHQENSEWVANSDLDPGMKKQAEDALEKYLLSQH